MATQQSTIDDLLDTMAGAGDLRAQRMFGEWAIYCNEKLVALVCNERLYMKMTVAGRERLGPEHYAPPYPGARDSLLVPLDRCDDADWLRELVANSAEELPLPKPKKPKPRTPM